MKWLKSSYRVLSVTIPLELKQVRDVEGVELCGTLKNVVAIAAGFVDGLEMGNNTKASSSNQVLSVSFLKRLSLRNSLGQSFEVLVTKIVSMKKMTKINFIQSAKMIKICIFTLCLTNLHLGFRVNGGVIFKF